jgi:hydroxymethylpyrimidine/phosphomethylpyrimidine kinase
MKRKDWPVALTIAGSDSGGGAGLQADLKTFAAVGVHGACVVTCVTAQNSKRILSIQACNRVIVAQQLAAVFEEWSPGAMKTGMLYSSEIIRTIVEFVKRRKHPPPLVVDPVLVASSGRPLLKPDALKVLRHDLLPLAKLITPNLPEAEALTGLSIREPEQMRQAARQLREQFGGAVLVKGGHLKDFAEALDIFFDGRTELLLRAPFIKGVSLHGTGCTYSAAITAFLSRGFDLPEAVQRAKRYITRAIALQKPQ